MVIFTCNPDFEAMMTCIYDAWDSRLGHNNIRFMLEPVLEPELFTEYRYIPPDRTKAQKVISSIQKKISVYAYRCVYAAAMSYQEERLDIIYRFLLYGFHFGSRAMDMLGVPQISALFELSRKVQNEGHYFREFTRFSHIPPSVYFAVIEPKCNILTLLAPHFVDRMPSESFLIADSRRLLAAVHPADEDFYLTPLEKDELLQMKKAAENSDPYPTLWKSFFHAIGIEKRRNPKCQRTHLPLWYRKNMTEFQ